MNTTLGIPLVASSKLGEVLLTTNKGINGKSTPPPGCGGCGGSRKWVGRVRRQRLRRNGLRLCIHIHCFNYCFRRWLVEQWRMAESWNELNDGRLVKEKAGAEIR